MAKTKTAAKTVTVKKKPPTKAHVVPVLKADDEGIQRCSLCRRPFFPDVEQVAFSFRAHIEQNHMDGEVIRDFRQVAAPQDEVEEDQGL
jgi:hypothetical protein